MAKAYREVLETCGEDSQREGLRKTPERAAKAMAFLTSGMDLDPAGILKSALFHEPKDEMVLVKDIEVYSLCEHHMLPFFGKAHVESKTSSPPQAPSQAFFSTTHTPDVSSWGWPY